MHGRQINAMRRVASFASILPLHSRPRLGLKSVADKCSGLSLLPSIICWQVWRKCQLGQLPTIQLLGAHCVAIVNNVRCCIHHFIAFYPAILNVALLNT